MYIPLGFAQVTHLFNGSALPLGAAVTFGLDLGDSSTAAAIAEAFHDLWATEVQPSLSENTTLVSTMVKFGPNDVGPSAQFDDTVVGGSAGDPASPASSILVRKRTALGGRHNRGRMYVPGANDDWIDAGGFLGSTFLTGMQSAIGDWFGAIEASPHQLVLLHATELTPTDIEALEVDGKIATQRRRLRR